MQTAKLILFCHLMSKVIGQRNKSSQQKEIVILTMLKCIVGSTFAEC